MQAASPPLEQYLPRHLSWPHALDTRTGVTPQRGKGPSGNKVGGRVAVGVQLTLLRPAPQCCPPLPQTANGTGREVTARPWASGEGIWDAPGGAGRGGDHWDTVPG